MKLYDSHAHYAATELQSSWPLIRQDLSSIGLQRAVVNGSSPADWPAVLSLAESDPCVIPAIGLHPWEVNNAPANWQTQFLSALDHGALAIGEIGLDQWIKGYDIDRQQSAFRWQLTQATERNLPVSIHCLRAIGPLLETLRSEALPARGIHLHAYNGPAELTSELVHLGAYFSFNAGQLRAAKTKLPTCIRKLPIERLLIETDSPDMLPGKELRTYELSHTQTGQPITHPATLIDSYKVIAEIRATPVETLSKQVGTNFETYFLN